MGSGLQNPKYLLTPTKNDLLPPYRKSFIDAF